MTDIFLSFIVSLWASIAAYTIFANGLKISPQHVAASFDASMYCYMLTENQTYLEPEFGLLPLAHVILSTLPMFV
ncbi:MAG: hypothetical protein EGQ89_07120 [Veillonella magna]|nr:hypothetical protein [Veillonella magna]